MVTKSVLITTYKFKGKTKQMYGRFDPVSFVRHNPGVEIIGSELKKFAMDEAEFVKHGKEI